MKTKQEILRDIMVKAEGLAETYGDEIAAGVLTDKEAEEQFGMYWGSVADEVRREEAEAKAKALHKPPASAADEDDARLMRHGLAQLSDP